MATLNACTAATNYMDAFFRNVETVAGRLERFIW